MFSELIERRALHGLTEQFLQYLRIMDAARDFRYLRGQSAESNFQYLGDISAQSFLYRHPFPACNVWFTHLFFLLFYCFSQLLFHILRQYQFPINKPQQIYHITTPLFAFALL
jgi:hypothetical protein